ncbi:MAG: nicotinate-nucleotide--dimethylbenzimidazole phosphoribosyltransferase [Symploca sp. SIO1B1]|nr:nicotinate-nucleotide--dimethylbenzimidazole phosphoribosyltransferase [Symploca sp. SIO1C2]NER47272.1 nicotinate-nucleotide--dimethylbenzimidazole phosphoribosyltransferase [Symploca sp. SIO1A3]NER95088.1 nicotinate-nucleotide--dimethylbenzimidazole phosphoribosyltransferase [Symploca sp. SIO1B1]
MIKVYTQATQGHRWLQRYQGYPPVLACILGFTATGLIPGISAAGATPEDRKYTAIADAEFLVNGVTPQPQYPLPPLSVGASPVFISRAVVEAFNLPVYLFNAGLPQPPAVPAIDLAGVPANCLSTGNALPLKKVQQLLEQGLQWGHKLAEVAGEGYLIIGECVVGGTTTALAVLTGLGMAAAGKVNSSHLNCNHTQKWKIVQAGLRRAGGMGRRGDTGTRGRGDDEIDEIGRWGDEEFSGNFFNFSDPMQLVAAVGDPMQIVAAGMAIAASGSCGVLLAGGTQMLAVYALAQALALPSSGILQKYSLNWQPAQVVVGTTRWVAEDPTGDTVGLAEEISDVALMATLLNMATSRYPQLQAYEQGYVKEGVAAGGCAIAASLYQGWDSVRLLQAIEALVYRAC